MSFPLLYLRILCYDTSVMTLSYQTLSLPPHACARFLVFLNRLVNAYTLGVIYLA